MTDSGNSDTSLSRTQFSSNEEECPHCEAQLQGAPIAAEQQDAYGATHFSRKIGIYSRESDRTVAWRCPDCGEEWSR